MFERPSRIENSGNADGSDAFCDSLLPVLPNLNAFAISLCGNRDLAKDLVQETVLKALEKQRTFHSGADIRPWLFTILRNTYISQRRKLGRETRYDADHHETIDKINPAQLVRLEIADFEKALASLPPGQKEALLLVVVEGFSYEETASICGCLIGTVKSRLNRARARLAAVLSAEPEGAPTRAAFPLARTVVADCADAQRQP